MIGTIRILAELTRRDSLNLRGIASAARARRNRLDALKILNAEFTTPLMEKTPSLEGSVNALKSLERDGTLMTVLIPEISGLSARLEGVPSAEVRDEVREFIGFLDKLVQAMDSGGTSQNNFGGRCFRVGLDYVGEAEKVYTRGVEPYLQAVLFAAERQIQRVYLKAIGDKNIEVARQVGIVTTKTGLGRVKSESGFKVMSQHGKVLNGITIMIETLAKP